MEKRNEKFQLCINDINKLRDRLDARGARRRARLTFVQSSLASALRPSSSSRSTLDEQKTVVDKSDVSTAAESIGIEDERDVDFADDVPKKSMENSPLRRASTGTVPIVESRSRIASKSLDGCSLDGKSRNKGMSALAREPINNDEDPLLLFGSEDFTQNNGIDLSSADVGEALKRPSFIPDHFVYERGRWRDPDNILSNKSGGSVHKKGDVLTGENVRQNSANKTSSGFSVSPEEEERLALGRLTGLFPPIPFPEHHFAYNFNYGKSHSVSSLAAKKEVYQDLLDSPRAQRNQPQVLWATNASEWGNSPRRRKKTVDYLMGLEGISVTSMPPADCNGLHNSSRTERIYSESVIAIDKHESVHEYVVVAPVALIYAEPSCEAGVQIVGVRHKGARILAYDTETGRRGQDEEDVWVRCARVFPHPSSVDMRFVQALEKQVLTNSKVVKQKKIDVDDKVRERSSSDSSTSSTASSRSNWRNEKRNNSIDVLRSNARRFTNVMTMKQPQCSEDRYTSETAQYYDLPKSNVSRRNDSMKSPSKDKEKVNANITVRMHVGWMLRSRKNCDLLEKKRKFKTDTEKREEIYRTKLKRKSSSSDVTVRCVSLLEMLATYSRELAVEVHQRRQRVEAVTGTCLPEALASWSLTVRNLENFGLWGLLDAFGERHRLHVELLKAEAKINRSVAKLAEAHLSVAQHLLRSMERPLPFMRRRGSLFKRSDIFRQWRLRHVRFAPLQYPIVTMVAKRKSGVESSDCWKLQSAKIVKLTSLRLDYFKGKEAPWSWVEKENCLGEGIASDPFLQCIESAVDGQTRPRGTIDIIKETVITNTKKPEECEALGYTKENTFVINILDGPPVSFFLAGPSWDEACQWCQDLEAAVTAVREEREVFVPQLHTNFFLSPEMLAARDPIIASQLKCLRTLQRAVRSAERRVGNLVPRLKLRSFVEQRTDILDLLQRVKLNDRNRRASYVSDGVSTSNGTASGRRTRLSTSSYSSVDSRSEKRTSRVKHLPLNLNVLLSEGDSFHSCGTNKEGKWTERKQSRVNDNSAMVLSSYPDGLRISTAVQQLFDSIATDCRCRPGRLLHRWLTLVEERTRKTIEVVKSFHEVGEDETGLSYRIGLGHTQKDVFFTPPDIIFAFVDYFSKLVASYFEIGHYNEQRLTDRLSVMNRVNNKRDGNDKVEDNLELERLKIEKQCEAEANAEADALLALSAGAIFPLAAVQEVCVQYNAEVIKKADKRWQAQILELRDFTPEEFGVASEFLRESTEHNIAEKEHPLENISACHIDEGKELQSLPFVGAIEAFRRFAFSLVPADQSVWLLEAIKQLHIEAAKNAASKSGKQEIETLHLAQDDIFPIIVYCAVQSMEKPHQAISRLMYLGEYVDDAESSYYLCNLRAAVAWVNSLEIHSSENGRTFRVNEKLARESQFEDLAPEISEEAEEKALENLQRFLENEALEENTLELLL
eukprot:g2312.t1